MPQDGDNSPAPCHSVACTTTVTLTFCRTPHGSPVLMTSCCLDLVNRNMVLIRPRHARAWGDKLFKDLGACYIGEGFRGSGSETCWDIRSEVKNKLYLLLLPAKQEIHVGWVLWILEAECVTLRILYQRIYQVVRSLTVLEFPSCLSGNEST